MSLNPFKNHEETQVLLKRLDIFPEVKVFNNPNRNIDFVISLFVHENGNVNFAQALISPNELNIISHIKQLSANGRLTIAELIFQQMEKSEAKKMSRSTITTYLGRLHKKGILTKNTVFANPVIYGDAALDRKIKYIKWSLSPRTVTFLKQLKLLLDSCAC